MTDITELATVLRLAAESEIAYRAEGDTSDLWQDEASPDNVLALVESLEKAQQQMTESENRVRKQNRHICELFDDNTALRQRIAELEESHAQVIQSRDHYKRMSEEGLKQLAKSRTVTVRLLKDHVDDADLFGWGVVVVPLEALKEACADAGVTVEIADADIEVEADIVDADVSNRNQPGMVVAVHIDVGDFVKFRGQVYEVKETHFDDHDVTLWFVCGEALKCAAGCQIEVISAPEESE